MTRKRIKEAAMALFAQKGYDATSMNDISLAVGIKVSSIYSHYTTKEELLLEITDEIARQSAEALDRHLQPIIQSADYGSKQVLYEIFEASVLHFTSQKDRFAFWVRMTLMPPEILQKNNRINYLRTNEDTFELFHSIFKKGMEDGQIRQGDTRAFTSSYYALVTGTMMLVYRNAYGRQDIRQQMAGIWKVYWEGLNGEINAC